ncbi:unnamed protein product [Rotaria sordida]|uniref:Uncharacterized protein n=1 Tax=Rotaria sordida TaxID=392033 RepID=A0A815SXH9_9BILA|nr:unnamed protein product [Rotaria sordida]
MSIESIRTKSTIPINREKMVLNTSDDPELLSSTMNEDSHTPLSETVTTLASNVYKELERIIKKFGENSVKDLMPVMISTLESLDSALHEREVNKLEIESLKEQTEQLFQQYEREKSFHKEYQQRYLQVEDHLEEIKRENEEKLRSLESIVKIFEIKTRNASDHIGRLEDKENEMKQEYKRLHDRYCELFKVHCDYMERTKILYGTDRLDQSATNTNSQSRGNLQLSSTSQVSNEKQTDKTASHDSDISLTLLKQRHIDSNFRPELEIVDAKHTQTESMTSNDAAVNTAKLAKISMMDEISLKDFTSGAIVIDYHEKNYLEKYKRGIFMKLRNLNLLPKPFDEQQFFVTEDEFEQTNNSTGDLDDDDDDDDISVDDTKNLEAFDKETRNDNIDISDVDASADLFGMTKEVSNLIKENNELLETKNALNVLKDDLLVKIEELSNELEIAREEVDSLQTVRSRLQSRITEIDEELRKTREELEKKKEEEENVPTEDRKRFTRVEMQRVLLERNQYKQRLFELEEAIHRQDALRASRYEQLYPSSTINTNNDNLFDQMQNKNRPMFLKLKGAQTTIHEQQTVQENSSSTSIINSSETTSTSKSLWRMFSEDWLPTSIVPSNILGVPVVDIQSDLREGTTQISEFFSGLFGSTAKDVSPKRAITTTTTTNLSSSTGTLLKHSPINDNQIETARTTNKNPPSERPINESVVIDPVQKSSSTRQDNSISTDDDNRFQAYVQVNVPIPIYNQPIFNTNDITQVKKQNSY